MTDQERWNAKHAAMPAPEHRSPHDWLVEHVPRKSGRALELACGLGHDAVWLAQRGWDVTAIDISDVGLQRAAEIARRHGVTVNWQCADLTSIELPLDAFDLIVVFNYLQRDRLPAQIMRALVPGGVLIYETFTLDQLQVPGNHLKNAAYLLRPDELLEMFRPLRVRHYRDVRVEDRAVASIVGEKT